MNMNNKHSIDRTLVVKNKISSPDPHQILCSQKRNK